MRSTWDDWMDVFMHHFHSQNGFLNCKKEPFRGQEGNGLFSPLSAFTTRIFLISYFWTKKSPFKPPKHSFNLLYLGSRADLARSDPDFAGNGVACLYFVFDSSASEDGSSGKSFTSAENRL